jgi:hypothetical protein
MMIRRRAHRRAFAALGLALLLAGSVCANAAKVVAKTYPAGVFTIAGKPVTTKDILDARAIPDMQGKPSLMITLSVPAAASVKAAAGEALRLPCTLDGKPLGDSPAAALASDHTIQLSGDFGDYDATAALARRISGKDPLPDTEGDE